MASGSDGAGLDTTPDPRVSTTVITILPNRDSLIFEDILQGIGVLLKNGAFVRFYCLFVGVFGYERAHSCAPVRKMSKK